MLRRQKSAPFARLGKNWTFGWDLRMPDTKPTAPLDLSMFDNLDPPPGQALSGPAVAQPPVAVDPRLVAEPAPERLVEIANLSPADLAAAQLAATKVDFRNTSTLLAHGEGALAGIAQASRQLLTGVRLEDAGEVGRIAASVIDGVNILRIQDLQAEARGDQPVARKGLIGRLLGVAADAHTAFKGFLENRRKFLDLMDSEQAKARKTKADLTVSVELLDQQALAIRQSLHDLKVEIAAGQLALDRGQAEMEALRQHAVKTGDAADAADLMEFRSAIANFRGKIAEMRENLVASAMLIPIIGQNKKAAETRIMKISNGMLVVIPRLMARSEEHTSELQSHLNLVCRLLLEKKKRPTTRLRRRSSGVLITPPCVHFYKKLNSKMCGAFYDNWSGLARLVRPGHGAACRSISHD